MRSAHGKRRSAYLRGFLGINKITRGEKEHTTYLSAWGAYFGWSRVFPASWVEIQVRVANIAS